VYRLRDDDAFRLHQQRARAQAVEPRRVRCRAVFAKAPQLVQ
jgi:hypothetical protein